ncbi:S8 family peptidase [Streptomyces dioscori]|uniref:S8 family peptidase n=1 Tax=Streptomyces dioscori TaxID=2109333 RepID=UPI001CECA0F2|nr:S8 family serine peptidase [Streptomyces dioscori]
MHPGRHRLLAIGTALVALTATPSAVAADLDLSTHTDNVAISGGAATAAGAEARGKSHTVTLLTGDQVTVTPGGAGPDTVSVQGPDGLRADARITRQGDDTYVYPSSADTYVGSGLLDPELFNVTRLLAEGYGDTHADGLPLIVSYASAARRKSDATSLPEGATGARALSSINSTALVQDRSRAAAFWSDLTTPAAKTATTATTTSAAESAPKLAGGIRKVWLDGKVEAELADSTAQIGAPEVWAKGNTGAGVDVAVLDTGYDTGHPDLKDVVDSSESFVPGEDVTDRNGHGTHVASTIAGSGAASEGGVERGVTPGARLHVGKVLSDAGNGYDSWIISGMEWAARDAKAKVVSMSLGSNGPSDGSDPMSQAVNRLSAETGTLFAVAAGNAGPYDHTVAAPGAADAALTVGAVDADDTVAEFSSRGPRLRDDALKPEITAPGVGILAARSQYTSGTGSYTAKSGTSMATPHVAGAAALVAAAHPGWTGSEIKDALVSRSKATPDNPADAGGNGRVDTVAATEGTLFATGTIDAGIHTTSEPGETVEKTVTWRNDGAEPVTVDLSVAATETAPAGLFTVADKQLVVPAGGSASTTVTTHLDRAASEQRYTAQLTAEASGRTLTRSLLGVSTYEEPFHLRVHVTDRAGAPSPSLVFVNWQRQGDEYSQSANAAGGALDALVRPGTYTVWVWAPVEGTHGESSRGLALLSAPTVEVRGDTDVTLDGTRLVQTRVVTPRASTDSDVRVDFHRTFGDDSPPVVDSWTVGSGYDSLWALPTAKPASGELTYTARWRMQQPLVSLTSGKQDFDDLWVQPGSADPAEGDRTLRAVHAGAGLTEDYEGLDARGRIAVVNYLPEDEEEDGGDDRDLAVGKAAAAAADQVQSAEKAGVALLVIVNDVDGRLREPVRKTPLTVVGLSRTEGTALIDRIKASPDGSVAMRTVTHAKTGYLYDLVRSWHGTIPTKPTYAPTERQLARVDVDFRNDPAKEVDEFRYDIQPYLGVKIGMQRLSHSGARRTDWVTSDREVRWMEEATTAFATQKSGVLTYPAGRSTYVQWFGPVQRPRVNVSETLPRRTGDTVEAYVPGWGDGTNGHVSTYGTGTTSQRTELYRGDTLVAGGDGYSVEGQVPAARAGYRLVTTTERTEGFPYSTSTRTEWGFVSGTPKKGESGLLPLVQLDYLIPTAADGTAERTASVLVTASHVPGVSVAAARVDRVEVSYDDGRSWQRASLSTSAEGALAHLAAPRKAEFLSVRVHASDARGNSVVQTIVRVVGVG